MKKRDMKKIFKVAVPLVVAFISIFVLSKYATSTEFHAETIQALDEKKTTVMELTAASTAASPMPGSQGKPSF